MAANQSAPCLNRNVINFRGKFREKIVISIKKNDLVKKCFPQLSQKNSP